MALLESSYSLRHREHPPRAPLRPSVLSAARAALEEWVRHGVQLTSRDWATALALGHLVAELGKAPAPPQEPRGRARTGAVE
jgi:hypothetical protein